MSVQYKTSDGWKNISSSSNNAVDSVADGNMSPVTSNAVYDKFASIAAVDSVTNGDLHPVTSNAVYDYPIDSITDGQHRPPTSNAVYDRLKPKHWTTSITIGTSAWDVSISRSVDMVHVKLRCTATGNATPNTNVAFPNAPAWCRVRQVVSCATSQAGVIDLQTNNSVTWWSSQAIPQNAEWNGTCLAYDADV